MAAYAATVTLDSPTVKKLGVGVGLLTGTIDVTNYNTTLVEISEITGRFKDVLTVLVSPVSDNLFLAAWSVAGNAVEFFADEDPAGAAAAFTELADDTDAGAVKFIAIGYI